MMTRRPSLFVHLFSLLLLLGLSRAQEPTVPPEAEAVANAAKVVLQPSPSEWEYASSRQGVPLLVEREIDGLPALSARRNSTALVSTGSHGPGEELTVRFYIRPPAKQHTYFTLSTGLESPDAKDRLKFGLSARNGESRISMSLTLPEMPPKRWTYSLDGIGQRKLAWKDEFRRRIEAYQADLPDVEATHWTLRVQVGADRLRVYLNDRLIGDETVAAEFLTGHVRVAISEAFALTRLEAQPLPEAIPGFELLPLGNDVNAAEILGTRLAPTALDGPEKQLTVDGIPFLRPAPSAKGHDHIDLGASWLPAGQLTGSMSSRTADITGRWAGAMFEIPMRIQLKIPAGRYRAIHLLAAADGEANSVPLVTAQFYRAQRGFPKSFATVEPVPEFLSGTGEGLTVPTADGRLGKLYRITIPVDPGELDAFDGMGDMELELTKEIKLFRAYPDPVYYSYHGAGLPSSVRLFAVTLERPRVELKLTPGEFADSFVAPLKPVYQVDLRNTTGQPRDVTLTVTTASYYARQPTEQTERVQLPPNGSTTITINLDPPTYGYHDVAFTLQDEDQQWNEQRGLVWLREDSRERGDWEHGRGPIFGFWNWNGGHETPPGAEQVAFMGKAGAETSSGSFEGKNIPDETREAARKYKMATFKAFGAGDHYITSDFAKNLQKDGLESATEAFLKRLGEQAVPANDVSRPVLCSFFPEPHIGPISYAIPPEYYNEEPWELTAAEEEKYQFFLNGLVEGAKILKAHYPQVKAMFPHGDPLFPLIFVQRSAEAREVFDGIAVDIPVFERLPEQQMHQVSLHRMYISRLGLDKAGVTNPILAMYEGPSRSAYYGALSDRELADYSVRDSLLLYVYGVDIQTGGWAPFESASYWGEQHYGGGIAHRRPRATPRPAYAAFASMTRHLNRRNFTRWLPTGSLSLFALEFSHYLSGEKMHTFWTLRGERPVQLAVPANANLRAFDLMDNEIPLNVANGTVTLPVTTSPCWVYGLTGDEAITLGEPLHNDATPSDTASKVASLGDGTWQQNTERDQDYEQSHELFVRRYPGSFTSAITRAPQQVGGEAMAVNMAPEQSPAQKLMPYYTSFVPPQPVELPGKGSHLGMWVRGTSDFGRVVYALRDSKGERWLSVGTKGAWNCDDIHNWSVFCYDGWRYLRFELPASSAWDSFREAGTVWWGSYGEGDGIVDLPLRLEKIIVERRTHAMYVNDPQPANLESVLLGDLFIEYARTEDALPDVVEQSQLRMPAPEGIPDLDNPIAELRETGREPALEITRISVPDQQADGTQCFVHFTTIAEAESYDVWASPYEDGRGALALGKKWTEDGKLIRGLRPETDFYLFVVYRDKEGNTSKPSAPFHIKLKDQFAMK